MNAPLTKREEITQLEAEIAAKNNHLKALVVETNHSPDLELIVIRNNICTEVNRLKQKISIIKYAPSTLARLQK